MNRNMIKHLQYIQLIIIILLGWYLIDKVVFREESMTSLEAILQVAKDNRMELEKVLYRYQKDPTDSLKYEAACFLIENMLFYTYSVGEQLDNYKSYYTWLKKSRGKTPQQVADSVKNVYGDIKEELEKNVTLWK